MLLAIVVVISVSSGTVYLDCGTYGDVLSITAVNTSVLWSESYFRFAAIGLEDVYAFVIKAF